MIVDMNEKVINILDKLLKNNDINLIDHILYFLTVDCNKCGSKIIPTNCNTIHYNSDNCCYDDSDNICYNHPVLCKCCSNLYKCNSCEEIVYTLDKEPLRKCDDELCSNEFCSDCFYESYIQYSECEEFYCCRT